MAAELDALQRALGNPVRPVAAVVGGAKVSSKIDVLRHLVARVDHLIIGGGMANTFLAARGVNVGKSLCEHDLVDTANAILDAAEAAHCTVHLPYDVVTSLEFRANPPTRTVNVHEVAPDEMILDIGPAAVEALADVLKTCATLVWNGPLGAFETPPFDAATVRAGPHRRRADPRRQPDFSGRRRRYRRRAQSCRGRGGLHLRVDRRRGVPRMDGGAHLAGRRGTGSETIKRQDLRSFVVNPSLQLPSPLRKHV